MIPALLGVIWTSIASVVALALGHHDAAFILAIVAVALGLVCVTVALLPSPAWRSRWDAAVARAEQQRREQ